MYKLGEIMENLKELDRFIKSSFRKVSKIIDKIEYKVENKTNERDLVTEVDREMERLITEAIKSRFPDHTILGEETYNPEKDYSSDNLWVIDPIDGTTNFVKQFYDFSTLLAYFENGEPMLSYIYDIKKDELYSAMKGEGVYKNDEKIETPENLGLNETLISVDIRRTYQYMPELFGKLVMEGFGMRSVGGSGLDGIRVIEGRFGAYMNFSGGPWDFAPYYLFCDELGLVFKNLDGETPSLSGYSNYIIATSKVYEDFKKILDELGELK